MADFTLIPVNNQLAEKAQAVLARHNLFVNIDQFIALYNRGILPPSNAEVAEAKDALLNAFTNLKILNGKFVVATGAETALEACTQMLEHWKILVELKRFANMLLEDGYDLGTKIVFTPKTGGKPMIEVYNEDKEETEIVSFWASKKLVRNISDLGENTLLKPLIKDYGEGENLGCYFNMEDVIDVDDSWLEEIMHEMMKHTFRANENQG